jgi:hypothetical protein
LTRETPGPDWDLEGNDAAASQWNVVTPECVDLIGTMSQAGKSAGYLMSLVKLTFLSFKLTFLSSKLTFHSSKLTFLKPTPLTITLAIAPHNPSIPRKDWCLYQTINAHCCSR